MKKNLSLLFCLITVVATNRLIAQQRNAIALELGLGKGVFSNTNIGYSSRSIKPLAGVQFQRSYKKHFLVKVGLQLQARSDEFDQTTIRDDGLNSKNVYHAQIRVNRLMLPMSLGYQLEKGNWTFGTHLGYRFVWMYNSNYATNLIQSSIVLPRPDERSGAVNPFTNEEYQFRVVDYMLFGKSKVYYQHHLSFSLSTTWKKRISLEASGFLYRQLTLMDPLLSQIPIYRYQNTMKLFGYEALLSLKFPISIDKKSTAS